MALGPTRERGGVVGRGGKSAVAKEETPGERTGVGRDGRSGEGLGRICTAISVELKMLRWRCRGGTR